MADFDDAVRDMTSDLLAVAGRSCVYCRGNQTTTITLRKSVQQSDLIDNGQGQVTEVASIDFIGLTTAFPYDPPRRGDLIKTGGETFEIQHPLGGEKVFRRITDTMTRVHTKQVR